MSSGWRKLVGLEAVCMCRVDNIDAETKVLLESAELIIRAPFRQTIKIADMHDVQAVKHELQFQVGRRNVAISLGPEAAAKWAKKIAAPPPVLGQKLGIGHSSPAFVIGRIEEPKLLDVLDGHSTNATIAKLSLAVVHDAAELDAALTAHAALKPGSPIWIVHGKGPGATFGEAPVRSYMRAQGFRDTKVSAVSEALTATRYSPSLRSTS